MLEYRLMACFSQVLFVLFVLRLNVPVNNFSVILAKYSRPDIGGHKFDGTVRQK